MQTDRLAAVHRWAGDAEQWLIAFLEAVASNRSIVAAVVMGSAVRERGHRRSDFDLLVIYRGKRPSLKAPMEVDIRFVPIEQVDEQLSNGHEILCWALKFGTALHDPELFWDRLERVWSDRIPLPSATDARTRAELAFKRANEMLQIRDDSAADDLLLAAVT